MNGIISISDGAGTTIENGTIISNDITTNSLTTGDLTLNGSLEIPLVNDIFVSNTGGTQLVSLYNKGKTYLEQDTHMNKAFSYNTPTTGYEVVNKTYVDLKAENIKVTNNETNATYYPVFTDNFGTSQSAFIDKTTTPFSINPNTGNMNLANTIKIDSSFNSTVGFFESKVAIGAEAGITNQAIDTLALGSYAGSINQEQGSMAFGNSAGYENQANQCVAIGNFAGCYNQASGSICIGSNAGAGTSGNSGSGTGSIIINAGISAPLNNTKSNALFINPIANSTTDTANQMVTYNATTKEVCRQSGITIDSTQTQLTVGTFQANGTQIAPTILNQYFQTPVRANPSTTFVATLTDWTFSGVSATSRLVHCRGGTSFNSSRGVFPISAQTQYLAYYFNAGTASITVSQNITFTQTGDYILTYYALGHINSYSGATETLVASIAGTTQTAIFTESVWCLQKMRFRVTSIVSPIQLSFIGSTTTTGNRIFDLYGIEIHKCIGVNVSDGGITNHQLLEYNGINTTNIFNSGNTINYGKTLLFGGLELYNRFAPSTTLLCDSGYGNSSTSTGGRVIAIGNASALNGVHLLDVMAIGVEACQNVGPVSFSTSYAGANTGIIAIGYRALRGFNGLVSTGSSSLQNYFLGHDAGMLLTIPTGSHQYNIAMGYQVLNGRAASTNIQYNALYGHNIMSTATGVSSTIQGNSVFGNESFKICRSANNTSCGYNNFNLATNTATNNNCFFGQSVCNTQAGASNVMTNCSFFGSNTDVTIASNYSNSTCLGYNSRIEFSNGIFLGTINEMTYAKGGLNLPVTTNLELNGNILANLTTITPIQLSFLNQVTANKLPSLAIEDMGTRSPSLASACSFFGNLAGNTQITTTTTGVHNSGFGTGTLKDNDAGSYNTAAGSKAGFSHDTGDYCTYVGYFAGGANTASNVTIVGANSCTTQTSIANATVIGQANSVADGNTNAIILGQGNTISGNNCGIIGYGITNNTANRIHIGNATQTVYIQNDLIVNDVLQTIGELQPASILHKKYYASAVNPTVLTAVTMSAPLYEYNRVNITVGTFSLPLSSEVEIGTVLRFRRITTLTGAVTVQIQTGSGQSILARNSISTVTSTVLMVTGITYSSIIYLDTNLWAVMD